MVRAGQETLVSCALISLNLGQDGTQPLVRHDVVRGHAPLLLEGRAGEALALVTHLEATIGVRMHAAALPAKPPCQRAGGDEVDTASVMERQCL